jgi:hypothetical protein
MSMSAATLEAAQNAIKRKKIFVAPQATRVANSARDGSHHLWPGAEKAVRLSALNEKRLDERGARGRRIAIFASANAGLFVDPPME